MNTVQSSKEPSAIFMHGIYQIDLSMVKRKLQESEEDEGLGWSAAECDEVEIEYKKFLALKRRYPEKDIVPYKTVDVFWHQHILDTESYAQDCETIFGYFLHHYPYFGMNGSQDKQNLINAFDETKEFYRLHFGDDYVGMATRCKAPKCRTQCKPMKCK